MSQAECVIVSPILNEKQKEALELIKKGQHVFITGPAGTGKSFLIQCIKQYAIDNKRCCEITASTGIAANNLSSEIVSATTLHARVGMGTCSEPIGDIIKKIKHFQTSYFATWWRNVDILVIEEASILSFDFFTKADHIVRHYRGNIVDPFGGIQIIVVADFFQLAPIIKNKKIAPNKKYCFDTPTWHDLGLNNAENCIYLNEIYRQSDYRFTEMLNRIRWGIVSAEDEQILKSLVVRNIEQQHNDNNHRTELYALNKIVDSVNQQNIDKLQEEEYYFKADIAWIPVDKKAKSAYRKNIFGNKDIITYIQTFKRERSFFTQQQCRVLERLQKELVKDLIVAENFSLKKGTAVILCANINFERGLINGAKGVVVDFISQQQDNDNVVSQSIPVVDFDGIGQVSVSIHYWTISDNKTGTVCFGTYPLKPAWALTIHKR